MSDDSSQPLDDVFIAQLTNHQAALHGYALASLGDVHDAKDVLQRTNMVLWKKASNWDPSTRFLPWTFAVARFEVLAHIRDRSRDRHVFDPDVVDLMSKTSEESLLHQSDRHDALQTCLEKLKEGDRVLLSTYYVAGKTLQKIAEDAGRKAGAGRVQIMRLRQILGDCIGRQLNP